MGCDDRPARALRDPPVVPRRRRRARRVPAVGSCPRAAGRLPALFPTVCVQLPMFNEHAVARRIIESSSAMTWPVHRLTVQALDDFHLDADTRVLVEATCERVRRSTGVDCYVLHRPDRQGYKAGALEEGRRHRPARHGRIRSAPSNFRAERNPIPVIVLTARNTVQDTVAGLEGGADDYMPKPFRFEELPRPRPAAL